MFLALFYVKYWLQSSAAADAAKNDLDVLQRLESVKRRLGSDLMEAMTEQAFGPSVVTLRSAGAPLSLFR